MGASIEVMHRPPSTGANLGRHRACRASGGCLASCSQLVLPQAESLGMHMRALPGALQPELVIVSPLRRALETAVGVFGSVEPAVEAGENGPPLMTVIQSVPGVRDESSS